MNKDCIYECMNKFLTEKRKIHTLAVRDLAIRLAEVYGENVEKAEIAAVCHDFFKCISIDETNEYITDFNLDSALLNNPNLAHGRLAAAFLERDLKVEDQDILNAVKYHTTGRANMSKLEKIIYLADAIEPNRSFKKVNSIRKWAFKDLNKACAMAIKYTADYLMFRGIDMDRNTQEALEYFEKESELIPSTYRQYKYKEWDVL